MSAGELDRLDSLLGIELPENYRRFMMDYPQTLVETKCNLGWTHEPTSKRYFRKDFVALLHYNEDVRRQGTPWTQDDGPWPQKYFVIGDDQCGNYYAIDLEGDGQEVWFYDHEFGRFERLHRTLEAFANELIRETLDFNQKYHPAK